MQNRIGLGTFPLAGVFNSISQDQAKSLIGQFIGQDGYYIDTAPQYGFGEVEKILGTSLKQFSRNRYFLISKCGFPQIEGKSWDTLVKSGKYDDVIQECEDSLRRLQTDYIDLYFVHSPDKNTPFEETMNALVMLQKQGKIGQIGVSNVDLNELSEYRKYGQVNYIQNKFSLINRSVEADFLQYLETNQIKLLPYHVLEIGLLTDRSVNSSIVLAADDLRNKVKYWQNDKTAPIIEWLKSEIAPVAKDLNLKVEELVTSWTLAQKQIEFVIIGTTSLTDLQNNLKIDQIALSDGTLQQIEAAYKKLVNLIYEQSAQTLKEFRGLNAKYY